MDAEEKGLEKKLEAVDKRLSEWRKNKRGQRNIPEELWTEGIKLAQRLGVCRVSKKLSLSYPKLKKKVEEMGKGEPADAGPAKSPFLELSHPLFTNPQQETQPKMRFVLKTRWVSIEWERA